MLDFSITDFKLSHGFKSKNGLINGHIGSFFKFFFMWPFLLCVVPWVIYFMFGVVWVLDFNFFLSCDKYLY